MTKPWMKKKPNNLQKKYPRKSFCIFTEGDTEELYFKDFNLSNVKAHSLKGGGLVPMMEKLKKYRNGAFAGYNFYWLVFDMDNKFEKDIQTLILDVKQNKYSFCFSNPCFEIWYLLHYDYRETAITSSDAINSLGRKIQKYSKTMPGIYDILKRKQETAIKNSQKLFPLEKRRNLTFKGIPNPSTNIDNLVQQLNKFISK